MIAGIVKTGNDSFRLKMETHFADDLRNMGYDAVSALQEFGPGGLANLSEEETYIKLCTRGIDAVIVIVLIDESKEKQQPFRKSYGSPNKYYYTRIWNYKNIQAELTDEYYKDDTSYFWESILFNLRTLEAEYTIQTKTFKNIREEMMAHDFEKKIIKKMVKEKIITDQTKNAKSKKPF